LFGNGYPELSPRRGTEIQVVANTGTLPMLRPISIALVLLAPPLWANDPPVFDRVTLSASASSEVTNDLLVAELFAQEEGQDPAALAAGVNHRISEGIEKARQVPDVQVRTLDYRTQPVYRNNRVDGWRVTQAIRIESTDNEAMSELIGKLQQQLSVRSIGYSVSPGQRTAAEDRLIEDAIAAFGARAERITAAFGRTRYRLVDVRVDTDGGTQPPRPYAARAMVMSEGAPPPALESGSAEIRVEVSGSIELQQ
jgi:predicted secreted protein